jgi:hypothetical protein
MTNWEPSEQIWFPAKTVASVLCIVAAFLGLGAILYFGGYR